MRSRVVAACYVGCVWLLRKDQLCTSSLCVSVTRMRDGDKGSASGVHAAEQTLPFAPERASGFGKTGKTHPHPQLIQNPITAAHQSQEGYPEDSKLLAPQTSTAITPSSDLFKTLSLSPREPHTPPCQETECPLHIPQHPGAYKIL